MMKNNRIKQFSLLALASVGMISGPLHAAPLSADGEVLIGFRATAGTGQGTNYLIDLGQVQNLKAQTTVQTFPLTGVAADLAATYGASWYARTDLFWGGVAAIGNSSQVSGNTDPIKTLYATKPEVTNGVTAAAWLRKGDSAHSSVGSRISAARSAFNDPLRSVPATNAAVDTAVTMPTSVLNSWTSYQPGGSNSQGIGFGIWSPQLDGNPSRYLDLFRMEIDTNDTPGDFVGRLVLNSNATLTFVPAAAVGVNVVQFSAATFSAAENVAGGKLTATVTRTGDTTVAASVTISTTADTATDPAHFTSITNQAVNFAAGEASKNVLIDIVNNPATQGDRSFNLALGGASGSISLGAQATAVATITDAALPSVVALQSALYSVSQGATTVPVVLTRTGGTASFTVTFTTTDETAVAGTDYTAPSTTVTFPANQTTTTVNIALTPTGATQHKQFSVTLSAPSGANTLGTLTTGVVRILTADANKPTVTVTAPAATVQEGGVNVIGSAADDKSIISRVTISVNGGTAFDATLNPTASGASFSESISPVGGLNTIQVQAFDAQNNASTLLTKTFTYVVKRALSVVVTPALSGTYSGLKTGPVYEVGKPIVLTAKAATGFIFDHWSGAGLAGPATEVVTLNVLMTDALAAAPTITAHFVANPFTALSGEFNGLVIADGSSTPSNATNGMISMLKVTGTGTFTGTLKIDGLSLPLTGLFDNTGVGKFGALRTTTLLVARPGKPSYELALNLDVATSANTNQITGTLKQRYRATLVSNSIVTLDRAANTVPSQYLANKGLYNVAFPARATQVGLVAADYPQGDGVGTITVTNLGKATLAATLADGTVITASSLLSKNRAVPFFVQLYALKAGSIGGLVTLDDTQTDSDVAGTNFFWFRPYQNVHYYPYGWPEGIAVDLVGTKFAVPTGASVVPLLPAASPNATLTFSDGLLTSAVVKDVTISTANVVTNTPADTSFKLTITAAKGTIAGDFTHTNGTKPKFSGIILQKGANSAAFGYFLTVQPKPITGLGESGAVGLLHK